MQYVTAYTFKVCVKEKDLTMKPEKPETDVMHLSVKWSASTETEPCQQY
jgi:hypothetical protein